MNGDTSITEILEALAVKAPTYSKPIKLRERKKPKRSPGEFLKSERLDWINNLKEGEVRHVLEEEKISLKQLKYRLINNHKYMPGDYWADNCHPRYGHLNENYRTKQFIKEMERFMIPLPEWGYSAKEMELFRRARNKADEMRIVYLDYVACLLSLFGEKRMGYTVLNYHRVEDAYKKWKKEGSVFPRTIPLLKLIERKIHAKLKNEKFKT